MPFKKNIESRQSGLFRAVLMILLRRRNAPRIYRLLARSYLRIQGLCSALSRMVVRNMWGVLSVAGAKLVSKYFRCFRRGELVPGATGSAVYRNPYAGRGRLCLHQISYPKSYCVIGCACRGCAARWREVNPGALGTGSSRQYLWEWAAAVIWVRSINTRLGQIGSASFAAQ